MCRPGRSTSFGLCPGFLTSHRQSIVRSRPQRQQQSGALSGWMALVLGWLQRRVAGGVAGVGPTRPGQRPALARQPILRLGVPDALPVCCTPAPNF